MNVIDNIKLQLQYPELKNMGLDEEFLKKAISDSHFSALYKKEIRDFIKYLKEYGIESNETLDDNVIKEHINNVLKAYNNEDSIRYISFIKEHYKEKIIYNNSQVVNDKNFDQIFKIIGEKVFDDNIADIINKGYSERFLELLNKTKLNNIGFFLEKINSDLFNDKIWNVFESQGKIGNEDIISFFSNNYNIMFKILNEGHFEELKNLYENIIVDKQAFKTTLLNQKEPFLLIELFDDNLIKSIDKDTLNKLFKKIQTQEIEKVVEISKKGNYEMIEDGINYTPSIFSFSFIANDEVDKDYIETKSCSNKSEFVLLKYYGLSKDRQDEIKLFLNSLSKISLNTNFKEKYKDILDELSDAYTSSDEKLIELSKKLNRNDRINKAKLIDDLEKDGTQLLRENFSKDLEERKEKFFSQAKHTSIPASGENKSETIDIYELTDQPFTMMIHGIGSNSTNHLDFANKIIENPAAWNTLTGGNNYISTSLISDKHFETHGSFRLIFGFSDIPSESIMFSATRDAGVDTKESKSASFDMRKRGYQDINNIATIDEIIEGSINQPIEGGKKGHNETLITRVNPRTGEKIQPNFVVCFNEVDKTAQKAAEILGIPIVVIHEREYLKKQEEKNIREKYAQKRQDLKQQLEMLKMQLLQNNMALDEEGAVKKLGYSLISFIEVIVLITIGVILAIILL